MEAWQLRIPNIIAWASNLWSFHISPRTYLVQWPSSFYNDWCPRARLVQSPVNFKRQESNTAYIVLPVGGLVCSNVNQLDNFSIIWGFERSTTAGFRRKNNIKIPVWFCIATRLKISATAEWIFAGVGRGISSPDIIMLLSDFRVFYFFKNVSQWKPSVF